MIDLLLPYKNIVLFGMEKNTGKTTVLNHLVHAFSQKGISLTLTSIGLDGEDIDTVTGKAKPKIFVPKDSIIITTDAFLDLHAKIIKHTNINTPVGKIIIAKILTGGYIRLAGPSILSQMSDLLCEIKSDKIIIDGSINRKSQINIADAAVLSTGAVLSPNINEVISKTKAVVDMYLLPEKMPNEYDIYIPRAVTDSIIKGITKKFDYIIADDPTKFFLSYEIYNKYKKHLAVKKNINLAAVTINPTSPYGYSFDARLFIKKMREVINIPVYNVMNE